MNTLERAKYRGKCTITGDWMHGDLVRNGDRFAWICEVTGTDSLISPRITSNSVVPETVGQWTGLKDKSGVDIFEGDIVSSDFYLPNMESVALIEFVAENNSAAFCFKSAEQDAFYFGQLTIIGNIHYNPELLEVVK